MKRRSFIATLAAGIAGLFVPLPKPVLVRDLVVDGNGALSWGPFREGYLIDHSQLQVLGCSDDHGPPYWKRYDMDTFEETRIVTEITITPEGHVVMTATPEPGILEA